MKSLWKECLIMTALIASALLCASCDYLRAALGKPTSAELDAMRAKVAEMRDRQRQDSLEHEQALADSLAAAADSIAAQAAAAGSPDSSATILSVKELTKQYYVIVGCFSTPEAAIRFCNRIKDAGYTQAQSFKLRSDRFAVTSFGSDTYQEADTAMDEISDSDICPPDIWIYNTKQKQHNQE